MDVREYQHSKGARITPVKWVRAGKICFPKERSCRISHGDDLVANFYPEDAKSQVKAMRRGGKIGNRRMQENSKANKPPSHIPSTAPLTAPLQAGRPDNEMEGNEMERNETDAVAEIPSKETVLVAAKTYPGDMARAIPAVIPEGWALSWYACRKARFVFVRDAANKPSVAP